MRGLNKVMLIGNLGRDPELRSTPGGTQVANFTLATSESYNDRSGNRQEKTEWHRVVLFGKLAEIGSQYLAKGRQVYIEGRLQTREWEDKQGQKRQTTEIVATDMVMLGGRGEGGGTNRYPSAQQPRGEEAQPEDAPSRPGPEDPSMEPIPDDDDLPF